MNRSSCGSVAARVRVGKRSSRRLWILIAGLVGCSDTPTGIRAVNFASSLDVDIATFTETRSGLFYKDVRSGEGTTAGSGSYATFFVQGWQSNGTEIQPRVTMSNVRLGAGELIPGVDEALIGMRVGGQRLAVVPPDLAYGQGIILVFRLELTSVSVAR